jgi:hypothetical protein
MEQVFGQVAISELRRRDLAVRSQGSQERRVTTGCFWLRDICIGCCLARCFGDLCAAGAERVALGLRLQNLELREEGRSSV